MIDGHRVVAITPAGRERYLRLLAAHVLHDDSVDEWQLWQNTAVALDLQFMARLAQLHPRVRLVAPPIHKTPNGNHTIRERRSA